MERLEILQTFFGCARLDNKMSDFISLKTNYGQLSDI